MTGNVNKYSSTCCYVYEPTYIRRQYMLTAVLGRGVSSCCGKMILIMSRGCLRLFAETLLDVGDSRESHTKADRVILTGVNTIP